MKRLLIFLIGLSLGAAALRADDQTQSVQQALKDQGFYYGQVDGEGGPETDAAVRRFQIRNGLDVTGKLNQQTLDALHVGNSSSSPDSDNTVHAVPPPAAPSDNDNSNTAPQPPPATMQDDHDFLKRHPAPAAPAAPANSDDNAVDEGPVSPAAQAPPEQEPRQPPPVDYSGFFRRTPYEKAPPVVQRDTVKRAQVKLAHEGWYRGPADGAPNDALAHAILKYQHDADIKPSGRLDMETLGEMDLLPHRHEVFRGDDSNDEPPERGVYRGIWVH